MILDLEQFLLRERPYWEELERRVGTMEADIGSRSDLREIERFHYLYSRAASDLAQLSTFSVESDLRSHLEALVARAYAQIHAGENRIRGFNPFRWFLRTFPRAFRRHFAAFLVSLLVMGGGTVFGGLAIAFDPDAKPVLMPFPHLLQDPAKRVAEEEKAPAAHLSGTKKTTFSAFLMTHNTRVSILTLALGVTAGFGTLVMLFSNGVMLGAVVADYLGAGQGAFLAGWLLPHGSVEIPSLLIAGQGGLLLGRALIGHGDGTPLASRLRRIGPDLVTLIFGVAVLLVWAGIIEAFVSQYHQPVLPYWVKIVFGSVQVVLLSAFLAFSGRGPDEGDSRSPEKDR